MPPQCRMASHGGRARRGAAHTSLGTGFLTQGEQGLARGDPRSLQSASCALPTRLPHGIGLLRWVSGNSKTVEACHPGPVGECYSRQHRGRSWKTGKSAASLRVNHARSFQRSEVMPGSPSYQPVSRWQIWTMTPSSLDDGQTGPSGDTPPRSCHVRGSDPESAPGP